MDISFFPIETYIFSTDTKEYNRDVRRKNYVIKYVNLLSIDPQDAVSLDKLVQNLIFFRNTFSKDAFLHFFNNFFGVQEKKVIGIVVYDIFIRSKKGEMGEHKDFYKEAHELYKYVDYKHIVNVTWSEIKNRKDSTFI